MSKKDPKQSARGKRCKGLRMMTGLSRNSFAKRAGIPPSSLQNWESPSANGLTEDGARRVIRGCAQHGVHGSFEWVMYGHGSSPIIENAVFEGGIDARPAAQAMATDKQTSYIQEELALFRMHYKESIDLVVPDDSMEPRFPKGAYVAGVRYYKKDLDKAIGHDCIILTEDGKQLLRHVKPSDIPEHYTLVSSNHLADANYHYLPDIKLVSAAPVLWMRVWKE